MDITVFREGHRPARYRRKVGPLSSKERNAWLEAIKAARQEYIQCPMLEQLSALLRQTLQTANLNADRVRVEVDPDDPDRQSLLLWYPTATTEGNARASFAGERRAIHEGSLDRDRASRHRLNDVHTIESDINIKINGGFFGPHDIYRCGSSGRCS